MRLRVAVNVTVGTLVKMLLPLPLLHAIVFTEECREGGDYVDARTC
jgi:hypothetical protein